MQITSRIIAHRKLVVAAWVLIMIAALPALMTYSHYISYSSITKLPNDSESQKVQNILEQSGKFNSTVTVFVPETPFSAQAAQKTLGFQKFIASDHLENFSSSVSPFSLEEQFINSIISGRVSQVRELYFSVTTNETIIFSFPYAFYQNWSHFGYSNSSISSAANLSGYNGSSVYERSFLRNLTTFASNGYSPFEAVSGAVLASSHLAATDPLSSLIISIAANSTDFLLYQQSYSYVETKVLVYLGIPVTENLVNATLMGGNVGYNYTTRYGLGGTPSYVYSQLVNKNDTAYLITITFNVPEGYIGKGGQGPSETDTPAILSAVYTYFGKEAGVTGNGPIEYQSQQITQKYAFVFPLLTFVLAIAVGITLVSWRAGIISLIFVLLSTAIGYISIFLTGLLVGGVNYIVNYTLTAVALGISTDYIVYMAARFREELRKGEPVNKALSVASSRAARSIVISGVTVAASLGMFSLLPGFESWGIVLVIAIFLIVAMITTLLPAVLSLLGSSFFSKLALKPQRESGIDSPLFYRAAKMSQKHKLPIVIAILILGAVAGYFFFHVPTTYNFNSGLPQGLESVHTLDGINSYFGSSNIYPIIVIQKINYSLNSATNATLSSTTRYLLSLKGVTAVVGPYSNGTSFNSSVSPTSFLINDGEYAQFTVFSKFSPYSSGAMDLVEEIRSNSSLLVGGLTSSVIDQQNLNGKIYGELEILIAVVIFAILAVSFRTTIYSLISLVGVFISISWTVVILFLFFKLIIGYSLIYLIPVILFIILMSLGNDYTVFLVSRIVEAAHREGASRGILYGMSNSGKVVTSLGLILAISLGSLALIPNGFLEELGFAFLISLVFDTFVIRTFFFPAMLSLIRIRGIAENADLTVQR